MSPERTFNDDLPSVVSLSGSVCSKGATGSSWKRHVRRRKVNAALAHMRTHVGSSQSWPCRSAPWCCSQTTWLKPLQHTHAVQHESPKPSPSHQQQQQHNVLRAMLSSGMGGSHIADSCSLNSCTFMLLENTSSLAASSNSVSGCQRCVSHTSTGVLGTTKMDVNLTRQQANRPLHTNPNDQQNGVAEHSLAGCARLNDDLGGVTQWLCILAEWLVVSEDLATQTHQHTNTHKHALLP